MEPRQNHKIFEINLPVPPLVPDMLGNLASGAVNRLLGLHKLEEVYARLPKKADQRVFLARALELFRIHCPLSQAQLERIPAKGPCVVVANHPFGAIEGIMLAYHLLRVRPDVKVMANYLLGRIPELRDLFIFVDPFDTTQAVESNVRPLRESFRWVKDGGLLAVFPAGEVAHWDFGARRVIDPQWDSAVARIAARTDAVVVPAYFGGSNGPLFQVAGMVHPRLRTAMLPRELLKRTNKVIPLLFGGPIPPKRLQERQTPQEMTSYLRRRTYILQPLGEKEKGWIKAMKTRRRRLQDMKSPQFPVAPAEDLQMVADEVAALPQEQILASSGGFMVFHALRNQAPHLVREIGRQRELCFRAVGEGTGKELDLDEYDDYYVHLCLWDLSQQRFAGAYRLGRTDEILRQKGPKGLYTHTLFKFAPRLFQHLQPALELGRSFVPLEYQRSYSALMLLWKGIGGYVLQHPHYRYLFGPVSVSSDYRPLSRRLIMDFLNTHHASDLSPLVSPRTPVRLPRPMGKEYVRFIADLHGLDELSEVVADLEGSGGGVPVLIKQYLKLNSQALAWNLDPDFGNAMDCLLYSDLMAVDQRTMSRYLGKEGYQRYLAHQRQEPQAA